MFGTIGGPELILILVIALIVFGPRKLPEIGKSIGKMMAEFRRASNDFKRTIEEEVEAEKRIVTVPPADATPVPATAAASPELVTPAADTVAHGSSAPAETDTPSGPDGTTRS